MYSLDELLRTVLIRDSLLSEAVVKKMENAIYAKTVKDVEIPYLQCFIRGKKIKCRHILALTKSNDIFMQ